MANDISKPRVAIYFCDNRCSENAIRLAICISSRWRKWRSSKQCYDVFSVTPMNTAHTAQYSLFTSAERTASAWLKKCISYVRLKRVCHLVRTCLTLCVAFALEVHPRAHLLPHSLFHLPRHQNTHYNRDNTIYSKNTQYTINLSKTSQSTSNAIKNHSVVKTCNPRKTFSTSYEPKELATKEIATISRISRTTDTNQWNDAHRAAITEDMD